MRKKKKNQILYVFKFLLRRRTSEILFFIITCSFAIPFEFLSFFILSKFIGFFFNNELTSNPINADQFGNFLNQYLPLFSSNFVFNYGILLVLVSFINMFFKLFLLIQIQKLSSKLDFDWTIRSLKKYISSGYVFIRGEDSQEYLSALKNLNDLKSGIYVPTLTLLSSMISVIATIVGLIIFAGINSIFPIIAIIIFYLCYSLIMSPFLKRISRKLGLQLDICFKIPNSIIRQYKSLYLDQTFDEYFFHFKNAYREFKKNDSIRSFSIFAGKPILEWFSISIIVISAIYFSEINGIAYAAQILTLLVYSFFRLLPAVQSCSSSYQYIVSNTYLIEFLNRFVEMPNNLKFENFHKSKKEFLNKNYEFDQLKIKLINLDFIDEIENRIIFKNVNLELNQGQVYAITGPSGSGKSTLVDVMTGLLPKTSGTLEINFKNNDKNKIYNLESEENYFSWPNFFSLVTQETILSNTTIIENITGKAKKNITSIEVDEVNQILKIVCLDKFIKSLPKGIFSEIKDHGINFSGGQKQRIAIAIAIFRNNPILIFDESTSALDIKTEETLLSNITEFCKSKIVIIISHRKKPIQIADKIIKFENNTFKLI